MQEELLTIDLDYVGPEQEFISLCAKFNIACKTNYGIALLTGTKQQLFDFLSSPYYEMDRMTIREFYPELLD